MSLKTHDNLRNLFRIIQQNQKVEFSKCNFVQEKKFYCVVRLDIVGRCFNDLLGITAIKTFITIPSFFVSHEGTWYSYEANKENRQSR